MRKRLSAVLGVVIVCSMLWAVAGPADAEPTGAPGTLLSTTDITGQKDAKLAGAEKVYLITYLTRNGDGETQTARASVSIPAHKPDGALRTMVWGHGTRGTGNDCLVSDKLGTGGRFDDWLGPWLKDGYVLVAPDYAGIGAPGRHVYLDGRASGRNMIDAVRASRTVVEQRTDRKSSTGYLATGGSQGGHAALWAGSLATSYAPELRNVGVAATSPPVDLAAYFDKVAPGVPPVAVPDYAVYFTYVMQGLKLARPDVDVDSYLSPLGRKLVAQAETKCYPELSEQTADVPVGDLVSRPVSDGPLLPALRTLTHVPTRGYSSPVLIQQGTLDPVAPAAVTEAWADRARADGTDVEVRNYQAGHGVGPATEAAALKWSDARRWPAS